MSVQVSKSVKRFMRNMATHILLQRICINFSNQFCLKKKNKFTNLDFVYFKEKFYLERLSLFHYITTFKTFLGHLVWNGFVKHILLNCLSDLVVENICILLIDLILFSEFTVQSTLIRQVLEYSYQVRRFPSPHFRV